MDIASATPKTSVFPGPNHPTELKAMRVGVPDSMRRVCSEPRCPDPVTYRGRCQRHARQRERTTHPNKRIYNSRKWKLTRRKQLHDHPLCHCGEIATDVDHIIPIEEGGAVWSFENLQSLCATCHGQKTRREQHG